MLAMTIEFWFLFAFWLSVTLVFWAYIGYPLFLWLLALVYTRPIRRQDWTPPVTIVITAYNEERRIRQKLENTLALDYPPELLEIIVVSDASTDRTEAIVGEFAPQGVKLLVIAERHGKHYGQGRGIQLAANELVVLTDATTFLADDSVRMIVRSYADPTVGVVSGEDKPNDFDGTSAGEGAYVRYEMKLRWLENKVGALVGASGCFFSLRKSLTKTWVDDMSSDFYMPLVARLNGYRAVVDHDALAYYTVLANPGKEFERKVRTVVHGFEVFFLFFQAANPFRTGIFAVQLWSHKMARWLVPVALIVTFCANLFLWNAGWFYQATMVAQSLFYGLALLGYLVPVLQKSPPVKIPLFFVMVNWSILVAWFKYLTGQKYVVWDATKR